MVDEITFKLKNLKKAIKDKMDKEIIDNLKLEIYSYLLGYFGAVYDKDLAHSINSKYSLDSVITSIQNILNTDDTILFSEDTSLNSITSSMSNLCKTKVISEDKCDIVLDNFILGYSYYLNSGRNVKCNCYNQEYLISKNYPKISKRLIRQKYYVDLLK